MVRGRCAGATTSPALRRLVSMFITNNFVRLSAALAFLYALVQLAHDAGTSLPVVVGIFFAICDRLSAAPHARPQALLPADPEPVAAPAELPAPEPHRQLGAGPLPPREAGAVCSHSGGACGPDGGTDRRV